MKHRRMIVFVYLLLSIAAYVLFAHWMWDGGTLGTLDPAEAGVLLLVVELQATRPSARTQAATRTANIFFII